MKKLLLMLAIPFTLLLVGCKGDIDDNTQETASTSLIETSETENNVNVDESMDVADSSSLASQDEVDISSNVSSAEESNPTEKMNEVTSIYETLYLRYIDYWDVVAQASVFTYGEFDQYVLITHEKYQTISDLKEIVLNVFTEAYYNETLASVFFDGESPLYKEEDGNLYRVLADGFKCLPETISEIKSFEEKKITFYTTYVQDNTGKEYRHMVMLIEINGIWYIDDISYYV